MCTVRELCMDFNIFCLGFLHQDRHLSFLLALSFLGPLAFLPVMGCVTVWMSPQRCMFGGTDPQSLMLMDNGLRGRQANYGTQQRGSSGRLLVTGGLPGKGTLQRGLVLQAESSPAPLCSLPHPGILPRTSSATHCPHQRTDGQGNLTLDGEL